MSFGLIRSIPLGRRTMEAWRNVGGDFVPRGRSDYERNGYFRGVEFAINLGNTRVEPTYYDMMVVNHPANIKPLTTPGGTRNLLGEFLPPQEVGKVWMKGPGRAGRNKSLVETDVPLVLPEGWDWQKHVEGQEYRIITVGSRVVQDFLREGENGHREYIWTPMSSVPMELKDMVRTAARTVGGYNVIAWDVVSSPTGNYIFEGNTSPGMSTPTAQRIVDAIRRDM